MRLLGNRTYNQGIRGSWILWRWRDLYTAGRKSVYLTRLYLATCPLFGFQLHWIRQGDTDPYCHDHPRPFISIVLWGWYREVRRRYSWHTEVRTIRWFNRLRDGDAHYIEESSPNCITLVILGRMPEHRKQSRKSWGFWVGKDWIYWRDFVGERGKD